MNTAITPLLVCTSGLASTVEPACLAATCTWQSTAVSPCNTGSEPLWSGFTGCKLKDARLKCLSLPQVQPPASRRLKPLCALQLRNQYIVDYKRITYCNTQASHSGFHWDGTAPPVPPNPSNSTGADGGGGIGGEEIMLTLNQVPSMNVVLRALKREECSLYNCVASIADDAHFVAQV